MQFLSYEPNEQAPEDSYGLMGIATVSIDGNIQRFVVKQGKDGNGFYVHPFSQKMNGQWFKSIELDSKSRDEELKSMIRAAVNGYQQLKHTPKPLEEAPF